MDINGIENGLLRNAEIERKFLVSEENLPDLSNRNYMDVTQGYIQNIGSSYIYRLRQVLHMSSDGINLGEQYFQTIKGMGLKVRAEYEIELLKPQFHQLWPLCENVSIHKFRYEILLDGCNCKIAYLDVYKNGLNGMVTVEVEFDDENTCDEFIAPDWFGEEVTHKKEYTNFYLSIYGHPELGEYEKQTKCQCKAALFTRQMNEEYEPICGKCGKPLK